MELDYAAIFKDMVKPAFIFDGRNILDHRRLYELGFNVYAVGKAPFYRLSETVTAVWESSEASTSHSPRRRGGRRETLSVALRLCGEYD